ncbi:uncharacterized protein LOC122369751 isoform X2 [Amphibalanus amphitrite]|uniref:uncharacterized protein LOC122369751 isoform X2 n=1 Tax=Amphibalanus amphitrite TaxID=1232801 RepID=UPI001C915042|nr:uncharacterized protein LOC122369751 isoform X2 [Amphibalanus amphitrite]
MCDCSLYVTSVTNAGTHISFHAQPNPEQFAVLDRLITQNQAFFEQARLPSPYQLPPGQTVLVKSTSSGAAKWHRARVVGIQGPTVSVEYIDYGTSELAHYTQICASRTALPAAVLTQPPLAVPCVLAEVLPATGTWTEAAFSHAESALRSRQPVQAQVLRQDTDGVWHVRVYTGDGRTLASQLAALGMGRLTTPSGQYPVQAACSPLAPASCGPEPPLAFATRVSELLSVPPLSGSEALVTICHYINGPAKFAVQLYEHQPALLQLMTEIQSYCQSSPPVPLSAVESGVVCLGSSASREGRYLRGVITQADGNVVKVYWADYGNDETKVVSELRAMPRQFTQLRIQASRVTLAGLSALKPVPGRAETIFRQKTEGSVLTGRFDKPRDQPAGAATGSAACLNQVELFDVGESVLEILIREGAYERRAGSAPVPRTPPVVAARRSASPPAEPPPLTPGTHAEVRVVSVTSVSSLHVRPLDTEAVLLQTLQRLTDALNVSACPLPMVRASEGSLCAVFKDASYQRARVMSVGRRDMKVLYIDLGTSEIIPAGAAFALEQDVANYPPQAVHCCLSGLEMSHGTPELVEQLRALTAGGRLLCEVLDQLGEKRIVRLTDLTRSPPLDVGAMLRGMMSGARRVKQSPSKPPPAAGSPKPQPVAGSPKPAPAAVTVRPPEVELGRPEHISVVYVESAAAFFGQLLSADVDAMYDMEAAMQERYGGAVSPLRPAPVGAFCVGRSTINETFYRAKVLLSASDKVTIQYIDYGDQESKAPSEVFPLLPEFTKLPQLGMFCCLAGGESVPEDTFSRLVQDQTLLVLPVFGSGDHYRVTLPPCSENQPLLAQLKPFGIAAASVPPPKSPAATNGSLSSPSPRPPSSSPVATTGQPSEPVKLTEPQLPVGLFKDVTVVHAVSPSEFYVRLREHSDSLARLEAELASYGTAAPAPVTSQQTVAVETAAGWRRGRVNGRKIDQVSVFLLDSGETVSVPMSSVRLLRSEHARLPAQAILCCAKGARPSSNGGWTDEETTQFRGSVAGRSFLARAEEARPGAPAVVTLAQAEPVRATALLHPGSGQQSPRSSDANNNTAKRTSPPPRADQDPNWRDKSTAVPPPSASSGPGWRPSDSRPNGGLRAAERRSSGSSAAAPSPRPPKPSTTSAAAPAAPEEDSEPRLERFVGKMRMDDPAEYAPVSRSSAGRGDGDGSSGRPSSRANGGDTRKPAPPAPARVEIPTHSATITRRPVPPGAPLAVTPTWVSGLARFYVQRCPAEPEFTSLMEEMQRFYSGLRAEDGQETQPQTGRPVAARFTDGAWYRALVRSVSPSELRVLFVDYGNCEVVPRREVKRLKEEHCRLPAQAYSCRFAGVEPAGGQWKTLDEKQLAKYFNGDMTVTASSDASGSVTAVEVTLSGQKVTDMLVADGLAVRPQPGQTLKQQHLGPFTGLPNPFRSGDKLAVFVSYIVTPDRLYCQLSERAADIEQLETQIETAVADGGKPLGGSAAAGAGCLAPFDGTFYRGVVVERTGDDAAVHFVDYGNTETVPAAQLLECPESLRRLPAQAIRLSLTGVPKDRTDDLTARADQMEFSARVDLVSADHLNVTLFDGETNLNVELGASDAPAPAPTQAPTPAAPIPTPASVAPSPAPAATPSAPQKHLGPYTGLPNPFRSGDKLAVFVSYIVSPDRLYCQLSERAADIEQLETQIETAVAGGGKPLGGSAAAAAGCLAPFDGTFYRGVVVERTGDDAAVHFVDYGNTETVLAAELLDCPESLRRLPAQAIRLSLTGVPKDRTDDLTARADQMEFSARVDLVSSDHLNVTLFDGETNVNVELGASATPAPAAPAPAPAAPAPAVAPAAPAPTEPQKTVTAPQAEQPSPAPETRPVAVSFTVSPGEFYVQDAAAADQLDELMARLETEYTKLADGERAVNEVQPGDLLAAPFSEDGAFYRARVLAADSADTSQLHLQFIDYGNSERCARSACRLLTPPLLAPAPFAQRCRLAGAAAPACGWTAEAAAALDTLTGAPDGQAKMVTVSGAGDCWTVKLIGLGGEDVAKALVEAGHATEEREKSDEKVTDAPTERVEEAPRAEPPAEVASLTDLVPGHSAAVAVSFSVGPCEFWVQLLSNSARLDTLAEALEAAGELEPSGELPVAESPAAGQLVAVRYSVDCAMYRARLLPDSDSAESRRVLFVDYGNTESVPVGELRCLPPQLTEEPLLAARCSLPLRVTEGAETAAAERFVELADSELELQMTLVAAGDPAIVTLSHEGRDLAGVLVEEGLAVPVEMTQKTEETREDKTTDTDGDAKVNQNQENTGDPAAESRLDDPGDHEVFVSHVNSPLEFYVQSPDTTALDDLMERLAAAAASLAPAEPPFEPTDLLAAPFSEDEALYRARVVSTSDDRARVQFVDYGNGEEVEAAALRRLPAELSELPPQALRCRLPVEACAASAVGRLRELTEEGARLRRLAASADADGPVALVRLTVDGRDVAETLAADGLCRLARRLTLPPALMPQLDTDMEASVTFVGTEEVFVMLSDDRTALGELRQLIAELYGDADPPPPLAAPAASDLCVVQDTNGGWNRATVLTVGAENTARVRLVDTGYILEGVALSDLRQPLQAVALPPPLVHRCHPAPDCDSPRLAEASSLDGLVTVRFTADGDRLMLHLVTAGTPAAPEVSSAGQTTEQPAAEEGTSPASPEVSAVGQTSEEPASEEGTTTERQEDESDSAATPRGRQYRDEKIVPGQISFSLIVPPTLKEEEPARDSQVDQPTPAPAPAEQLTPAPAPAEQLTPAPVPPAETQVATAPDGTPLGRRISHEFKIVPGQISFSLLSEPETREGSEPTADECSAGEKSQSVDGVEDAGEIDVETSKTESAAPAEDGGVEADAVAEAMPEDAEIEAVPEDAAVEATPADAAEVGAASADAAAEAMPADAAAEATPADAEVETTPAVAETEAKPEDAKVEATPAVAEVQGMPEDAASEAEAAEAMPTDAEAEATPADAEAEATPAGVEVSPIGGEVEVKSPPVEAGLETTSVEANADVTLSDPEAEGSSAAVAEAGLVTVEAEEEFVSADENDDMILVVSEEDDTPPGTEAEAVTTDGKLNVKPCETGSAEVESAVSMTEPTPVEATPAETEIALAECTPTEATPTESVPAETTPAEPTPAESVPVEATPDQTRPTELTPAEAAPTESECTPAECTPSEAVPTEAAPTEAAPVKSAPARATPAESTPTESAPAAETAPAEPSAKTTQPETLAETTSPEAVAEANEAVAEATTVEAVIEATPTEASTEDALDVAVISASEAIFKPMLMEVATEAAPEAATEADPEAVTGAAPKAVTELAVRVETVIEAAPELVTGVASEAVTDATPETVTETSTEAVLESAPKALTEAAPETATSATSETLAPAPKAEASPVAGHASMDAKVTTNEDATSAVSDKEDVKPLTVETAEEGTEPRPARETEETVADVQEEPVVFVSDTLDNAVEDQVRSPDGQEETAAVAGGHDEPAKFTERPDDPSEKTVETSEKPAQPSGETVTSSTEERTEPSVEPVSASGLPIEPIKTAKPTDESATTKEKVNPKPSKESPMLADDSKESPVLADDSNESPACADDSKESLVLADAPAEASAGDPSAHSAETVKPSPELLKGAAAGRQGAGDSSSEARRPTEVGTDTVSDSGDADCV